MAVMFRRNRAALLSIQLLVCYVVAGHCLDEHRNISRGGSVTLTCNIPWENVTQIKWIKDTFLFSNSFSHKRTFSNFSSDRVKIDSGFPSTLNIFNAQHHDSGLYRCQVFGRNGTWTATWNLTMSEKPEEMVDLRWWYLLYTLTTVTGLLLCGITAALCLCREHWTRTPEKKQYDSRTLTYAQYCVHLGEKVAPPQPPSCVEYKRRTNGHTQ